MSAVRGTVVALGEVLLRLKSPGHERLLQSPLLEATFGGAEANVVMALAGWGAPAAMTTVLPAGPLGDAAVAELRRHGVETRAIARDSRVGARLGVYYLEAGAGPRPSRVVYDRAGSAFAEAAPDAIDWGAAFAGASWLHVSGITPAVSARAASLCLAAVEEAKAHGLTVSCDYNYRAALWQYGRRPAEVMRELMRFVDVGIAGREDCQQVLGIDAPDHLPSDTPGGEPDLAHYAALAARVLDAYPSLRLQAITLRAGDSASRQRWSACMLTRGAPSLVTSRSYELAHMVDRVGAGDAFSAGLVYALAGGYDPQRALDFAAASAVLKHSIPGDVNRVSVSEVEALARGEGSGRVQR